MSGPTEQITFDDFLKVDVRVGTGASRVTIGAEVGLGALFQLRDRWYLTPGLRYSAYSPDFGSDDRVAMRWAVAQLGLLVSF